MKKKSHTVLTSDSDSRRFCETPTGQKVRILHKFHIQQAGHEGQISHIAATASLAFTHSVVICYAVYISVSLLYYLAAAALPS